MRTLALSLLFSLAAAPSAWALSCESGPSESMPLDASVDVPTNVLPRIRVAFMAEVNWEISLVAQDEMAVEGETQIDAMGTDSLLTFVPTNPLAPNTRYTLSASAPDTQDFGFSASFTTGAEADDEPPAPTAIDSAERVKSTGEWGDSDQLIVEVSGSDEPVMYRVEVMGGGSGGGNNDIAFIAPSPVYELVGSADSARLAVGEGLCRDTGALPNLKNGLVSVTAIDLAGNESVVVSLQGRQVSSGGCSSLGSTAPAGLLGGFLVALGLVGIRRRRLG